MSKGSLRRGYDKESDRRYQDEWSRIFGAAAEKRRLDKVRLSAARKRRRPL